MFVLPNSIGFSQPIYSSNASMSICSSIILLFTIFRQHVTLIISLFIFLEIGFSCSFKHPVSPPYNVADLTQKLKTFPFFSKNLFSSNSFPHYFPHLLWTVRCFSWFHLLHCFHNFFTSTFSIGSFTTSVSTLWSHSFATFMFFSKNSFRFLPYLL